MEINSAIDERFMKQALDLAAKGQGRVEPNPMVGCVVVRGDRQIGEGFHSAFGRPHAEVEAISDGGQDTVGATMYVTLEPCCHQGKTPPCTAAILAAGIARIVVATSDPYHCVDGGGIAALKDAGVEVVTGVLETAARDLNAPYFKRIDTSKPWIIAKWAMTLDGKIATHAGHSRWISGAESRIRVHQLRGRVDAIMVGRGSAVADDPLLTARPPGPRTATRIVLDSKATLSLDSQLVRTARETPVLIASGPDAPAGTVEQLTASGCEVLCLKGDREQRLDALLLELASRHMTNVLVEGGGALLGSLSDARQIDEVHAFIAPIFVGGDGQTPVGGDGVGQISEAWKLNDPQSEILGQDVYVRGR
ncbi:MAG: bifunctional diaminohydroxyphosphoribosylaminopyrimidine deaminase/5-amino-6-(5-phosphoribosylamino)uracil reductase RibD, partial [Planctomycetales bacterium]